MKSKLLLSLVSIVCFGNCVAQKPGKKLIEYTKSYEKTSINANVLMPSFSANEPDTQTIRLKRKNDAWIYLKYVNKGAKATDTVYVATYTENRWKDGDAAIFEMQCYTGNPNCGFIISSTELHYVRFRSGNKVKTYKLLVTN
jgi:hypothetical protein